MKRLITSAATLVFLAATAHSPASLAQEGAALAKSKACFSCHQIKESGGHAPALEDVARRYKGQKNADLLLADKIKYGTSTNPPVMGHWGANVMPPSGARVPVNDEEAKILAKWVLSLS